MDNNIQLVAMEELVPLFIEQLNVGGKVRFSPRGNSMKPMLRHGVDTVELSPVPESIKKYDLMLYRRDNGKYIIHRVVKTGETYNCIGDNQYFVETDVRRDQMIAIVSAFSRNGKDYSVTNFTYRIYCRFWHYSRFPRRVLRGIKHRIGRILKGCK